MTWNISGRARFARTGTCDISSIMASCRTAAAKADPAVYRQGERVVAAETPWGRLAISSAATCSMTPSWPRCGGCTGLSPVPLCPELRRWDLGPGPLGPRGTPRVRRPGPPGRLHDADDEPAPLAHRERIRLFRRGLGGIGGWRDPAPQATRRAGNLPGECLRLRRAEGGIGPHSTSQIPQRLDRALSMRFTSSSRVVWKKKMPLGRSPEPTRTSEYMGTSREAKWIEPPIAIGAGRARSRPASCAQHPDCTGGQPHPGEAAQGILPPAPPEQPPEFDSHAIGADEGTCFHRWTTYSPTRKSKPPTGAIPLASLSLALGRLIPVGVDPREHRDRTHGPQQQGGADEAVLETQFEDHAAVSRRGHLCRQAVHGNRLLADTEEVGSGGEGLYLRAGDGAPGNGGRPGLLLPPGGRNQEELSAAGDPLEIPVSRQERAARLHTGRGDEEIGRPRLNAPPPAEVPHPGGQDVRLAAQGHQRDRTQHGKQASELLCGAQAVQKLLQNRAQQEQFVASLDAGPERADMRSSSSTRSRRRTRDQTEVSTTMFTPFLLVVPILAEIEGSHGPEDLALLAAGDQLLERHGHGLSLGAESPRLLRLAEQLIVNGQIRRHSRLPCVALTHPTLLPAMGQRRSPFRVTYARPDSNTRPAV